ncbi:MAG TPA: PAS domain S-box protein [Candidatus Nanoarchaeia archaeon]|nr:PAS domain S-box protein [Candidatus Nanoarchaeia archaeon]
MQELNETSPATVRIEHLIPPIKVEAIKVLHVDDDPSVLEITKLVLQDMGNFEIDSACCVDEALQKLKARNYDAVVSDYEMPQRDGLEFLTMLKTQENEIPVILFTGKGREEVAMKALNLGANGYFNKQGTPETVYGELAHGIKFAVERKKAQEKLHESELKYHSIFNNSGVGMFRTKLDGSEVLDFNKKYLEILGYNREEIQKKPSITHWADSNQRQEMVQLLKANGEVRDFECRMLNKQGKVITCLTSVKLFGQQGILEGSIIDISERKKVEETLTEKNKAINTIINSTNDGIYALDAKYQFIYISERMAKLAGSEPNEMVGQSIWKFFPKVVGTDFEKNLCNVMNERKAINFEWQSFYADKIWEIDAVPYEEGIIVITRDITELKSSEEKFRLFVEGSPVAIFVATPEGKYEYVNEAACKMLGYTRQELTAMTIPQLQFEENIPDELRKVAEVNRTGRFFGESILKAKNGKGLHVILNGAKLPNGKLIAFCENITERKKAEEKLAAVNEKLRVVGKLTRHDVRNKLLTINSNVYLLKRKLNANPEVTKYLVGIESATATADRLLELSRQYERIGVEEQSEINVKQCFNEAIALLPDIHNIKFVNGTDGLTVVADSLLRQLFYNLIDNSLKHGNKTTQIRLYYEKGQNKTTLFYEDDGVGVPTENKPKVFNEGFTTNCGSGLGLAMIKKMVDAYGWTITEEGQPEKGAKFVITIPRKN